ncbi:MAG: response regulator [Deltaproteobacteria bacterium]|nr:response regulator [Deltaproteobacteria bacterium]MBW1965833.1 response regulator [Deltaproteobacteria bacterium]
MAKIQILIVEDDGIIAKDIQNTLEGLGYAVAAITSNAEGAIEKAAETQPDLVLMDIMLEGDMDGVEAAEQIRDRFGIPVVYLTAHADEKTLHRAKTTGPYGYILKPFNEMELHTNIEIALYKSGLEKKLKENEQLLATTLRSIGDAVITTDVNGSVTFMNPVAESLTGWRQKDAVRRPLKDVFNIIDEHTGEQIEDPVTRVLRDGVAVGLANNTVLIAKDGTKRSIDDSGAPIKDCKGNIMGVVLVFRDITEKRRAERELLKADKLESLGVLSGGIAHDFNNILTSILGNISIAKMFARPGDKIFERLEEAENDCMRARVLTQKILTFSRGGAPIMKTAFISELLRDSASFALSGSNVRCEFSIPDDLWRIEVDEGQIAQAISNLIINASQAMPGGGVINLLAENIVVDEKQGIPLNNGGYVKISVTDHGIGIPKEHFQQIFDPYYTTKRGGSGLGLAIAYSIVKRHNGYIDVKSIPGKETTFSIYLPASPKEALAEKESGEKIRGGKGKILVMDDEKMIRDVVGDMLGILGYEAEFAKDGAEAVELYKKAEQSVRPFDAVIMDLTVPGGMGGKEAVRKLAEIDPEVKAIVSSGYSDDPVMADFRKYGFSNVVAKPYNIKELGDALYEVLK